MVVDMYKQLLLGVKNHFSKPTRSVDELKGKLHQLFQETLAEYDKFASWYDDSKPTINAVGKAEYEHYVIENYKKSVYGSDYNVKKFEWLH